MTPDQRQRLLQFASDNGLCITVGDDSIVDIADNEPWPSREEVLGYPNYQSVRLEKAAFADWWDGLGPSAPREGERRHDRAKIDRNRKANKAARKARRNRR